MTHQAATPVLVSVCIANYDGIDVIDACLQSVLAQEGIFNLEVIVHDDRSNDDSLNHVRDAYPTVTLISSELNVGYCISNNRMAAAAKGEYLLLLNNDATLFPDAIDTLLKEAIRLGQPAILTLPQYDAGTGELLDMGSRLDPFLNCIPNETSASADVGMVAGACLWIDRVLWEKLGGFPFWFGSLAEDLFLCCYARRCGYPVRALSVSGYRHRVGFSFGGGKTTNGRLATSFTRRALSERNKTFVILMCYPSPIMQVVLPFHVLMLLVEGLLLSLLKRNFSFLEKIYWPVVPALWQERRSLCKTRSAVSKDAACTTSNFFAVFSWFPRKLTMLIRHGLPTVR